MSWAEGGSHGLEQCAKDWRDSYETWLKLIRLRHRQVGRADRDRAVRNGRSHLGLLEKSMQPANGSFYGGRGRKEKVLAGQAS